jgi:uncharacterized membrane protein YphA (DoxX/SURF4 family)
MATNVKASKSIRARAGKITLWILQVLLAALFLFAGITKLFGHQPEMIEAFNKIGLGQWFRYFTGVLEVAGGIGIVIPRVVGLAAIDLGCVMVGAIVIQALFLGPVAAAVVPAVILVVLAFIARSRRSQINAVVDGIHRLTGDPAYVSQS